MKAEDNYIEACKMVPEGEYGAITITVDYFHKILLMAAGLGMFDGQLFPIGSKLTSKEDGQLVIASPDTPDNEIVGIVI